MYDQVMEQFQPVGLMDEARQLDEPDAVALVTGEISASNPSLTDDTGAALVDGASFVIDAAEHVALVGGGGSGKNETTQLLARLLSPTVGTLRLGGASADDLPEAVTGRRLAYVGPAAYMFSTTVRDNLLYGVKHLPLQAAELDEETTAKTQKWLTESDISGNFIDDLKANWVDYAAAGVADDTALLVRIF